MSGPYGHEDGRPPLKSAHQELPSRGSVKSMGSGFLDRATRTFSFGGQKKHTIPPPKEDDMPEVPPLNVSRGENLGVGTSRGMAASAASPAAPASPDDGALDLGGDFGSMFKTFDKRASTATLTMTTNQDSTAPRSLTGHRHGPPPSASPDIVTPTEPLLSQSQSPICHGDQTSMSPKSLPKQAPPPVPRHEHLNSFKYSSRPNDIVEDEDAKFLQESFTAMNFLSEASDSSQAPRHRRVDDHPATSRTVASGFQKDENLFEGNPATINRGSNRHNPRQPYPPQNKVMTPAQFEKYRQDKENVGFSQQVDDNSKPAVELEDDDDINYDDDDDDQEKSKQQARQRRKQEAHMAVYRQQMMKVTGETNTSPIPLRQPGRPSLVSSSTVPVLGHLKTPSPDPANVTAASSEEDDEDVPLAILQAHGFPRKNRPPTRLAISGSNPNLRVSITGPSSPGKPSSVMGDPAPTSGPRQSSLPAFARHLPQDPFVGASIVRPSIRESLTFGDARQPSPQPSPQPPQGPLPPGGLVGVIASEERSRAMRRGSPSTDPTKLIAAAGSANGPFGHDPFAAAPPNMMYSGGGLHLTNQAHHMNPTPPQMSPSLTPGHQAQLQMSQQMNQFMQMQMQFMQMMATNQTGGGPQMQHQSPVQPPYRGSMVGTHSMGDLSRHSMVLDNMLEARPTDTHTRTMSMVQPSSASFMAPFRQGPPSIRGPGNLQAPSIAPSERSNVGLPGRYRPVSQAPVLSSPLLGQDTRSNTISGGLSTWSDDRSKSTIKLMSKPGDGSDDDEEKGWETMKTKREKKQSLWRSKKTLADEVNIAF
ncbi:hypothetical protein UVI_02048350 [Ustilaginoidea virens]|uniref:Uncharacterized protein n=1 Tax=Ustilaginoidea virens TaxID=1159556 RepID=A0A1B5KVR0_USTVR|nr:hypothetical protein UVI_02048350 [Ustilaginoidea virens]